MKKIKKNRLLFVRSKGDIDFEEEVEKEEQLLKNRFHDVTPEKKRIHPAFIVVFFAVIAISTALIIINYYYGTPQIFTPSELKTHLAESDKKDLPEIKIKNKFLEKGKNSFYKGQFSDAISQFQEVVESDVADEQKAIALTYIGIIYDDRGEYDKAVDYYKRALKYNPEYTPAYRNLALTYRHAGNLEEAVKAIEKALDIDPENLNNMVLFGNLLFLQNRYKDAAAKYEKALEFDKENPSALYNLALTRFKLGDEITGIEYLKRAGTADRAGEIAHLSYAKLGVIFTERKDYEMAKKYLELAASLEPEDPVDRYNLGIVYLKEGDLESAVKEFEKAEEFGREDAELLENLGEAYYSLREYDKSIEAYNRLLNLNIRSTRIISRVAEINYKNGNLEKAYNLYKRITVLNPVSENARIAYLNMGNILDDLQRYEEAIEAYENALSIDPKDVSTLYNLGIVYKHLGKDELAIETWQKASELKTDDPKFLMAIADYYYEKKLYDHALDEYSRVIRRWPNIQDAHFNLAVIYYKRNLIDYSEQEYKKVIEINGKNDLARKAYINLGILLTIAGRDNEEKLIEAQSNVKKALLLKPGDPEALSALGAIFIERGLIEKAIETFYQAISATDDTKLIAESYNYIGKSHYKEGMYKKALQAFTRAIEAEPTLEDVRINRKVAMQAYERELNK